MGNFSFYGNKNNEKNLIVNDYENFSDMEEIKEDIYMGTGNKRMKAYICNLKIDELNKKREYFWSIKTNINTKNWRTWKIIHRAVLSDEIRSSLLLEEYNIKPVEGCINHLIDDKGNHYKIPNYCINDPYYEKIKNEEDNLKEDRIILRFYGINICFELEANNQIKGIELKMKIKKERNNYANKNIRLFESGSEIKDDDYLYKHNLNHEKPILIILN